MITLYFEINNINDILSLYNQIEIIRYTGSSEYLTTPVGEPGLITDWITISGTSPYTSPIALVAGQTTYYAYDMDGNSFDWYSSRYSLASDPSSINSGWSTPVLGDGTALYVNPLYPSELSLTTDEKNIVDKLRLLIGDRVELKFDSGDSALTNFHPGGLVYTLEEKGWPISINMAGTQYTDLNNPAVNGYKYLKFRTDVSEPVTVSGVEYSVNLWYYTFRHSDKELLRVYDYTTPPLGLSSTLATTDVYIISAAINIIQSELLLDATEDGSRFSDGVDSYDPSPGLQVKQKMLEGLKKQLDDIVRLSMLRGISGVRIE